ncbi:MFS transporter [Pseudomonas gingeri]|uniref:MFS transporter n=1 Tax=Pseudomonas gingeri TaxID=117681 RepID=A0A7Y7YIB7_9PSED|nr:MFS transporter [Pseudomonas gingeri]NWA04487.1 MFS transporter [Pseudomonas gingeri]NWA17296.1 MFS transporter [Pseudomonas gingeri]NWA56318.1 MFS transporter [Pseudomonas gingeri]NWA98120.1 MFS transporter [Pseudomonas gingeri]NWB02512.1 MFS transporter [Pseudomonas gingeri]
MLSTLVANRLARRQVHYGWVVAAVTFLTMLVMAGAMGAPGVFIVPLEHEFGWSSAQISSALAIRFMLYGLIGPFAAAFMNYFGLRRVVLAALVIVLGGMIGSMFMNSFWQLVLLWGVVIGIGTGLTAMVLGATVATRWFSHRRGLVVGLLSASSATGQLLFMPLMASLTEHYGWRLALGLICAAMAVVVVTVLALLRDRPADMDLPLYGEREVLPAPAHRGSLLQMLISPLRVLRDVSGSWTFWVLFLTFFVCGASTNGLIQTHFISMCGDFGLVATTAAGILAMMGIFDFFGTVGSGWLSDRFDNRWLLFWYYGLRGISLMLLPFTDFTVFGLSFFAVLYGLDWIATVPPTVKLVAQKFGGERANIVFGWVFAGHQLGAAFAAYGAGLTRTLLATYIPAFFIAGMLCVIAALIALSIPVMLKKQATN